MPSFSPMARRTGRAQVGDGDFPWEVSARLWQQCPPVGKHPPPQGVSRVEPENPRDGDFELVTLRNGARAVRHLGHGEVMHPSIGPWQEALRLYVDQPRLAERLR